MVERVSARAPSLTEKAYQSIKDAIFRQEILPGQPLLEVQLAEKLGISRTPVRDAISKLEREELLKRIPNWGVMVPPIELKEIHDVFELREILELGALQKAFSKGDQQKLTELRNGFEAMLTRDDMPLSEIISSDEGLHLYIAKTAGNLWLLRTLRIILQRNVLMRLLSHSHEGRTREIGTEHVKFLECWLKGDLAEATLALRDHIRNAKNAVLQMEDRLVEMDMQASVVGKHRRD